MNLMSDIQNDIWRRCIGLINMVRRLSWLQMRLESSEVASREGVNSEGPVSGKRLFVGSRSLHLRDKKNRYDRREQQ